MDEIDYSEDEDRSPPDAPLGALAKALRGLELFGTDPYLSMQATNLDMVDVFIGGLEAQLLQAYWKPEGTPVMEATFLSAQSQMWIFGAYEALRTWRERAKGALKLAANGGFPNKIADLRRDMGFRHHGRLMYADQLERLQKEPSRLDGLRADLRRVHIPFARMDMLRDSLAKHEVKSKANSVAYAPGYGRIDMWSGALKFELSTGPVILDTISRRDIADEIRATAVNEPPSDEDLASFDEAMKPENSFHV